MHRDVYHALDYLTYASLQLGQDAQAGKWVKFVESNQTFNEQTRQITIKAWIARAEGRNEEALKLMRSAADREDKTEEHVMMPGRVIPVREMLGELLLELKRPIAALAAFEESQQGDPRRFRNFYGAGRAAELAGKGDKARTNYSQLLQQVGTNAAGRPEIEHAKAYVGKL
jgi:tetratricopeptide (TPR) repeat protein